MEQQEVKGVLFDAFGTLCRIESPRLPYRSILKRWPQGTVNCYQALLTRDASLAEFAERAGLASVRVAAGICGNDKLKRRRPICYSKRRNQRRAWLQAHT